MHSTPYNTRNHSKLSLLVLVVIHMCSRTLPPTQTHICLGTNTVTQHRRQKSRKYCAIFNPCEKHMDLCNHSFLLACLNGWPATRASIDCPTVHLSICWSCLARTLTLDIMCKRFCHSPCLWPPLTPTIYTTFSYLNVGWGSLGLFVCWLLNVPATG